LMDKLLGGIVGFELAIESIEGKWKLSQNHPVEHRRRVISGLTERGGPDDVAISQLMAATLPSD
ncbi:MAG: FMN-binding negative transcriptional regulator, partial [Planctomycetaceae bacterium]